MAEAVQPQLILLIDDTPANLGLLARHLSGYRTHLAGDGEEAFKALDAGLRPDLILLDVMLPGQDGFEVCRRLKADATLREVPVIFMAGIGADHETSGFAAGGVDFITKPFNHEVVRARVDTHLALANARRRLAEDKAILEEQVAQRTEQLAEALKAVNQSSLETIVRLARAAEYKDEDTGEHVLRMSYYAAAIARRLGLAAHFTGLLLRAAPMHDIGKIGIPDRVLLKRGPLTPDEREIIKRHPEIGAKILSGSHADVMMLGEVCALTHHERWDGTGYPRGLGGADIPLPGRILAVADSFDALTSRRPYKEAWSVEDSFAALRDLRGEAYDPQVVDAFFEAQHEILDIKATYVDKAVSPLFRLADTRHLLIS
ncbi:MAG: response regulator [Acidobacteria bacterium]|nr:MAG: response regulator [Acidobacteriota bacterium]